MTHDPDDLTVEPGGQATTKVTVRNLGTRVEEFELVPQGPGAAFATVIPPTVQVYPDVDQRAVVRFAPPRSPESQAGVSTFEVVARSVVHSDVRDVARGRLTVGAFESLQAVLQPDSSRGRRSARHQVVVTNGGNTSVNAQVAFTDQGKVLTFEPKDKSVALQPGNTVEVPVLLNGPVKWFGRTQQLPFSATVTPAGAQPPIMLNGMRQQTAMFPWWMPPAVLAFVALILAVLLPILLRTPKVPTIGNVDELTATKRLAEEGYIPLVMHKTNNDVSKGLAIGTDPAGSTPLAHGQVVKLIMSNGKCEGICPVTVTVPNVVGMQQEDATAKLQQAELGVLTEQKSSDETAGKVIDTKPAPAAEVPQGGNVTLLVSTGPKPANPAPPGDTGKPPGDTGKPPGDTGKPPGDTGKPPGDTGKPPGEPIKIPALKGTSVEAATKALTDLGLKAKVAPEPVHSNAVPTGKVLSIEPQAATDANPGSEVTLTKAQNTDPVNLIDIADNTEKAKWTATAPTGTEKITVGSKPGTTGGLVNQRSGSLDPGKGTLVPSTVTTVLETHPPDNGLITGEYTLDAPAISGDHVKALVGVVKKPSTTASQSGGANQNSEANPSDETNQNNEITFSVMANEQVIKSVTLKSDTLPQQLDADLSKAEGAKSIKIRVTSSEKQDPKTTPVWQGLRLEPKIGQ